MRNVAPCGGNVLLQLHLNIKFSGVVPIAIATRTADKYLHVEQLNRLM